MHAPCAENREYQPELYISRLSACYACHRPKTGALDGAWGNRTLNDFQVALLVLLTSSAEETGNLHRGKRQLVGLLF